MLYAGYDETADMFMILEGNLLDAKANKIQRFRTLKFFLVSDMEADNADRFHMPTLKPLYVEESESDDTFTETMKDFRTCVCLWELIPLDR